MTLLEQRGHTVVVAPNGRKAVQFAEDQTFDVIPMDVQMPEMSGLEATAAIRERERSAGGHIPIVAMTAHAMTGDRERCLDAGMDGYVSKPLRPDELVAAIDGLFAAPAIRARSALEPLLDPRRCSPASAATASCCGSVDMFLVDSPNLMTAIRQACVGRDAALASSATRSRLGRVVR